MSNLIAEYKRQGQNRQEIEVIQFTKEKDGRLSIGYKNNTPILFTTEHTKDLINKLTNAFPESIKEESFIRIRKYHIKTYQRRGKPGIDYIPKWDVLQELWTNFGENWFTRLDVDKRLDPAVNVKTERKVHFSKLLLSLTHGKILQRKLIPNPKGKDYYLYRFREIWRNRFLEKSPKEWQKEKGWGRK